jgi:hypothetical protein
MALDFPTSPTTGQVFGNYTWDGEKWKQTATAAPALPGGRLTLSSGSPVMTAAVAAGTTVYWTPYLGSRVPLYNGTAWVVQSAAEISVLTTNTTKNPAAIGASKVNDWFLWDDAGTLRLSHGPDWTNDTTRSAGTALVMVDGTWLNNAAITNACAASRGTYVGTTRSDASSKLIWNLNDSAAGGAPNNLYVWNMYNRVNVSAINTDTTANWTYTVNTTRPLNNSANNRSNFVSGLAEESILAHLRINMSPGAVGGASIGLGLDSSITMDSSSAIKGNSGDTFGNSVTMLYLPQLGVHFIQALERGDTATTVTFGGSSSNETLLLRLRM